MEATTATTTHRWRGLVWAFAVVSSLWLGQGDAAGQVLDARALDGLSLRSIGPAVMGGRINDLAVVEGQPWIIYVGTASGGLWKTTNKGTTWQPIFDAQATPSIGDVTVAPSDPEVVWVGTGEPNNRQSSTFGRGAYKSIDGGRSWEHVGLAATHHIGRIAIHPQDPATVYVAALGHLWGANPERGVYRTRDGGKTWAQVLFLDEDTGVADLAMDPINPRILYAAAYQRRRAPWGFDGGGPGSGLYKTTDGGDSWRRITDGLPADGPVGRIGLEVYRLDPRIVYATVQHAEGGVFRSSDRGERWEKINDLNPRAMYYSQIRVDPTDARRVYVLGAPFYYSDDGGVTFVQNREMTPSYDVGVHGDHHALWIDPANPAHLILGGDGGLYFSWDRGRTWDKVNNIPLGQFYAIGVDMEQPYNIYGGLQDTHSFGGPSATRTHIGILNSDWYQINFGDGMYQQIDPTDADTVYTESQGGNIVRFDRRTGDRKSIKPYPLEGEEAYRFHWTAPILLSPHDPSRLYLGGNRLFTSTDRGETWAASEDLTRAEDRDALPIMGRVPDDTTLSRHDGVSSWGTITTIAESPVAPGLVWVGTDDGSVQLSRDEGQTWTSHAGRFPGLDDHRALISRIVASHASAGRAYVAFDRHRLDDFDPFVYTTDDYGETWRAVGAGLPSGSWVNVIVEHPRNPSLLFAGTETGLFVSVDRGAGWLALRGGFPTVPVDDLVIHPRDGDLVVGTHGRSIYVLDDLTPLVQATPDVLQSEAHLFDVRPALEFLPWKHESYGAQRQFVGENPPYGALLTYYLRDAADTEAGVELVIRDAEGTELRRLPGPRERGFNRVAWDLRAGAPARLSDARGPLVPPGAYTARLELDDFVMATSFEVLGDPRAQGQSEGAHRARFDFLIAVNEALATISDAVRRTEEIGEQVRQLLDGAAGALPASLRTAAEAVAERSDRIQAQLRGAPGGGFGGANLRGAASRLFGELDGDEVRQGTLAGPTALQRARFDQVEADLDAQLAELRQVIEQEIPDLNRQIAEADLDWIRVGSLVPRR